jgi:hypothetical protein
MWPLFALVVAACTSATNDTNVCPTIAQEQEQLLATLTSCMSDDDCIAVAVSSCAVHDRCAAAISAVAKPQLDELQQQWARDCTTLSQSSCTACDQGPASARCVDGVCRCEGAGC